MKLSDKFDILIQDVHDIKMSQVESKLLHEKNSEDLKRNTDDLKEHMRRTDINEQSIQDAISRIDKIETEKRVVIKVVTVIVTLIAGAIGLAKTLGLI